MKIAFVQDIATPHNNVLLGALRDAKDVDLTLWYCEPNAAKYDFKADLANAVVPARFYKKDRIDWSFLAWALGARDTRLVVVGWMNINTRLLILLFWLLRRKYCVWFDLPQDGAVRSPIKKALREFFYWVLKTSRARVFAVGKMTVDYFLARGFAAERVVNLPIFVTLGEDLKHDKAKMAAVRKRYGMGKGQLLISSGSRLVFDKGYDVLVEALGLLQDDERALVKCVIVGKGEEEDRLRVQVAALGLDEIVTLEAWLPFEDFQALIAASEVFAHPARFDAFGGTIFAHALGTPVLGSRGAGAALDRVEDGVNGWLYGNDDPAELAELIRRALVEREQLAVMGLAARATAERWSPAAGAKIVKEETR